MDGDNQVRKPKQKRRHDVSDREHTSLKRRRDEEHGGRKHRKHQHKNQTKSLSVHVVEDDPEDEMWLEQNVDIEGKQSVAADVPSAEDLKLISHITSLESSKDLLHVTAGEKLKRDEWMLEAVHQVAGDQLQSSKSATDLFSDMGIQLRKKPSTGVIEQPKVSARELNSELRESVGLAAVPSTATPSERKMIPGGPGSQWRMMKLRRVYETAEEEGKSVEEVAMHRFGSMELFEEAKVERQLLDERADKRGSSLKPRRSDVSIGEKRFMFTDVGGSGASSRSSTFRRPGTSTPAGRVLESRYNSLRLPSQGETPTRTPVPTVMAPSPSTSGFSGSMSPSSLNKLQAKILRAKLIGAADAAQLQEEYDREVQRASPGDVDNAEVRVLPTLDSRGRLYDVGLGREDGTVLPGNRPRRETKVETRDPKTGEIVLYNPDDDTTSLGEMLRQERFGAGMADQKDIDAQYARAILSDGKFENDLDYIDDNAEKLGRQKMRSDALKRQFAINDYKKTQKVLAECQFCYTEDDTPPKAPIIAMGTRVYLSCTLKEELVPGHCLIVPIQHHLAMLEGDDDVWDEVRNFMKSLMQMFAADDKGVIFYETVISLKWQRHTVIECVPLPWEKFDEMPAYFKESILMSEAEWSQHKKLIDFSARPGGFRRAMVPNLPYFMVQFDYKSEKGYGHVIEGPDKAGDDDEAAMNDGEKGGSDFPSYFAGEIIGNVLDLEPRRWRRPRRVDSHRNRNRVADYKKTYDKYDWTDMIGKQP